MLRRAAAMLIISVLIGLGAGARAEQTKAEPAPQKLFHVSFGFTKAFFVDYNAWFTDKWKRETGETVIIEQSHAASGTQTRAILEGKLEPDVVTLASPGDLDAIAEKTGSIEKNWRAAYPNHSSPYYSAVVFLVRPGNPKSIKDWADLALPDRTLVTSDPKACGGGRWNYAAAFGLGAGSGAGASTERAKEDYLAAFVKNAPVFYANQGEAGKAFLEQKQGDVLLTYESFALELTQKPNPAVELVLPSRTVEIELPVAVARKNTDARKTTKLARAYLQHLYDPEVQLLFTKHHFRPRASTVAAKTKSEFPKLTLVKSEQFFGPGQERAHFAEGGVFDGLHTHTP